MKDLEGNGRGLLYETRPSFVRRAAVEPLSEKDVTLNYFPVVGSFA
jgi:hypothetical protein